MAEERGWFATLLARLPELFHILLAVLGIAIVFDAASGGFKYRDLILLVTDPTSRIALAAFGLLVLGLGLYLTKSSQRQDLPKAEDYGIKITSPSPNQRLTTVDIKGEIKKSLPDGFVLWVFRVSDDGRFYPVRKCVIDEKESAWEAPNCDVGGKTGSKRTFSVNIVGKDGLALISYVREVSQTFRPIRDEVVACRERSQSGKADVPYLPSIEPPGTRDIVPCHSVRVERE